MGFIICCPKCGTQVGSNSTLFTLKCPGCGRVGDTHAAPYYTRDEAAPAPASGYAKFFLISACGWILGACLVLFVLVAFRRDVGFVECLLAMPMLAASLACTVKSWILYRRTRGAFRESARGLSLWALGIHVGGGLLYFLFLFGIAFRMDAKGRGHEDEPSRRTSGERKRFEGTWYSYVTDVEGKKQPRNNKNELYIFSGRDWTQKLFIDGRDHVVSEGTFTVKEWEPYWVIDFEYTAPKSSAARHRIAIYRFDGDTLQLLGDNIGTLRFDGALGWHNDGTLRMEVKDDDYKILPKTFETKKGDGNLLMHTLKRLKVE